MSEELFLQSTLLNRESTRAEENKLGRCDSYQHLKLSPTGPLTGVGAVASKNPNFEKHLFIFVPSMHCTAMWQLMQN